MWRSVAVYFSLKSFIGVGILHELQEGREEIGGNLGELQNVQVSVCLYVSKENSLDLPNL